MDNVKINKDNQEFIRGERYKNFDYLIAVDAEMRLDKYIEKNKDIIKPFEIKSTYI